MVRTAPSQADIELIAMLAARGVVVSATQLERWRRAGLLPRPQVSSDGRLGTRVTHPGGLADLVASVARHARRGRPLEITAFAVFLDGHDSVSDGLLLAGVRRAAENFAAEWERCRAQAVRALQTADPDAPVDELAIAEHIAAEFARNNGRMVRQWRRNLRRHPPPDATADNRENVLGGALTTVFRLMGADQPEADDSLVDLAAASGSNGAFETAPFADSPAVPEGAVALRGVFGGFDAVSILRRAGDVTADELRHGFVVFSALSRVISAVPEDVRYFLGALDIPCPDPENPEGSALMLLAFLKMSAPLIDTGPLIEIGQHLGLFSERDSAQIQRSARWLNARPVGW